MELGGFTVLALQDGDGAVWWAEEDDPNTFRCMIGDRLVHASEVGFVCPPECDCGQCHPYMGENT